MFSSLRQKNQLFCLFSNLIVINHNYIHLRKINSNLLFKIKNSTTQLARINIRYPLALKIKWNMNAQFNCLRYFETESFQFRVFFFNFFRLMSVSFYINASENKQTRHLMVGGKCKNIRQK